MPQFVDITSAYGMKRFHKEKPKRLGLWSTLIASNLIWLCLFVGLSGLVLTLIKTNNWVASLYQNERWELSRYRNLTAKELAERDMKIARLIKNNSASTADVLTLAKKISAVLDSAPARHRQFFEKALPEAMHIQVTQGVPASAVLAMSIYESSYGTSQLAAQYNNFFGIKAFNTWSGPRAKSMPTKDLGVQTRADFRAYPNMSEGFQGYVAFLKESNRYNRAFKTASGSEFVRCLLEAGYCPDSTYLHCIKQIMERHQLQELDNVLETTTSNVAANGVDSTEANAEAAAIAATPASSN